jgi:hypothetical protein
MQNTDIIDHFFGVPSVTYHKMKPVLVQLLESQPAKLVLGKIPLRSFGANVFYKRVMFLV